MFTEMTKEELAQIVADQVKAAMEAHHAATAPKAKAIWEMTTEEFQAETQRLLHEAETARRTPKKGA